MKRGRLLDLQGSNRCELLGRNGVLRDVLKSGIGSDHSAFFSIMSSISRSCFSAFFSIWVMRAHLFQATAWEAQCPHSVGEPCSTSRELRGPSCRARASCFLMSSCFAIFFSAVANLRVRDLTWTPNVRFSFRSVLIVDLRSSTDRRGMSRVLGKLRPTRAKNGYSD